jgi:DNA replication protein DnaC
MIVSLSLYAPSAHDREVAGGNPVRMRFFYPTARNDSHPGAPGTGKTHLAVARGVKAVEHGFSVAFYTLEDLLHAAREDVNRPPKRLRGVKYLKSSLLIIDEMGFQSLAHSDAGLLFRVVNYRYDRGSTIITTNKSVKDWPEILAGDEIMATAILDRLLHRSHVINIKGRSYRLKDLEKLLQ